MSDRYIKTLEAQNLQLREENALLQSTLWHDDTEKEIWYCRFMLEEERRHLEHFFSPQGALEYFRNLLMGVEVETPTEDISNLYCHLASKTVFPNERSPQIKGWLHIVFYHSGAYHLVHTTKHQNHIFYPTVMDFVKEMSDLGISVRKSTTS